MRPVHRRLFVGSVLAASALAQQYEWHPTETRAFGLSVGIVAAYDQARHRAVCTIDAQTWEYDGAAWRLRGAYPSPFLGQPGIAFDAARGVVTLFGGTTINGYNGQTWRWDGSTWAVIPAATNPPARWFSPLAYDSARQRIVLFGGEATGGQLGDTWEFDGTNWTLLSPVNTPNTRLRHTIAYDEARARTVLFGGMRLGATITLAETWEWDGIDWTQRAPAASPPPRRNHGMAYDRWRARTVVFGGYDAGNTLVNDTWEYDGATWQQVAIGQPAPPTQVSHTLCFDSDRGGVLYVEPMPKARTWSFDGTTWRVALAAQVPNLMLQHAMAHDPQRGETLLCGPLTVFGPVASGPIATWVNRGGAWMRPSPATLPPTTQQPALAFDAVGGGIVMFGGRTPLGASNVTWRWTGIDWQTAQPATTPPPRIATALATDSVRGRIVMFGGENSTGGWLADTWEWNGADWLQRTPPASPPSREGHAMVYDPIRQRTVMFGGGDLLYMPTLGDHWEWDGNVWTQITVALPPARSAHSLVFDQALQKVVMIGGQFLVASAFGSPRGDVWTWDGGQWQLLVPVGPLPPSRRQTIAAHDATLRRTLLFSGEMEADAWLLGPQSAAAVTGYGSGCPGTFGLPELRAVGEPFVGNPWFGVQVTALLPGAWAGLGVSATSANVPLPGGCALLVDQPFWFSGFADAHGAVDLTIGIPNLASLHGVDAFAQAVALDPQGALGGLLALSSALRVTLD